MSEIRQLLADAQSAELRGEKVEAARLFREAASFYREREQLTQATRMLRQARRVEGVEEDEAEFEIPERVLVEQRTPRLADASADAWCSFCCCPKRQVGPLVEGPAGAFICRSCTEVSRALLAGAGSGE